MEYANLIAKLLEKRIDLKAVAAYLGIDEKTTLIRFTAKQKQAFHGRRHAKYIMDSFLNMKRITCFIGI